MELYGKRKGIHIGIIPDGSRRWARKSGIENYDGKKSGNAMERAVTHIFDKYPEVEEISVWAVSTENLKRPQEQKDHVFGVLDREFKKIDQNPIIQDRDIRVNVVGSRLWEIPDDVRKTLNHVVDKTRDNKSRRLNVCIGYGGKEEIVDAAMGASRWLRKNPAIAKLHENVFERFLMVPRALDIVIRTGGERRLSGFMLYQIEYAELFFIDKLWPDFSTEDFDMIMKQFRERERRFGK